MVADAQHHYGSRRPLDESFARNEESRRRDRAANLAPIEDRSQRGGQGDGSNPGLTRDA
jgi:hypothetical protein